MRIRFDELRVDLPGHRALDGVSGEIASGEVTAILGPSGAGKTTLLRVLAGLTKPDAGLVRFDGDDVSEMPPEARRLGVVFQDLRLFDFLSGRENVRFGPRVANLSEAEQERRVGEALLLVHAEAFAERPARVLSGGERQRIALARALATQPKALLLDEPFGSLDAELRRTLRDELRTVARALGLTVLLITHDRDDAFATASHLIVLRQGRVEQAGEPASVYERPETEYVARLLGDASLLPIAERQGARARVAAEWIEVAGAGTTAVLRPEQVALSSDGAGWPAKLVDARFVGGAWRLVLDLEFAHVIALVEAPPQTPALRVRPTRVLHTV